MEMLGHAGAATAPVAVPRAPLPPTFGNFPRPPPSPLDDEPKKKRARKNWGECTNCDSKHSMRYGIVVDKKTVIKGCDQCKKPDWKDMTRICECGAGKDRRYGIAGSGDAIACAACKDDRGRRMGKTLVNLRPSTGKCGCGSGKVKRFGWKLGEGPPDQPAGSRRTNCFDCKKEGMVNLSLAKKVDEAWGGKCRCGSKKTVRYGLPGSGRRTNCYECKTPDMVNLTTKMCPCTPDPEAQRQLRFGFPGGKMTNCSQCKTEGMVDLTKKQKPVPVTPPVAAGVPAQ